MSITQEQKQLQSDDVAGIDELGQIFQKLKSELAKIIVGQNEVIERLAICLFARGHALLMGVPGLAKTLLISRLAETMSLKFCSNPVHTRLDADGHHRHRYSARLVRRSPRV